MTEYQWDAHTKVLTITLRREDRHSIQLTLIGMPGPRVLQMMQVHDVRRVRLIFRTAMEEQSCRMFSRFAARILTDATIVVEQDPLDAILKELNDDGAGPDAGA